MRSPATAFWAFLLVAALGSAAAPAQATTIFGNVRASLSADLGFEGLYRYDVDLIWTIDPPSMDRADIFVQLEALDDTCGCVAVQFGSPAGQSDGLNCVNGSCDVNYRGKFFCTSDATSPFPNHGAAARFKPIEQSCGNDPGSPDLGPDLCAPTNILGFLQQQGNIKCTMANQGTGHFVFYSSVPPSLPKLHQNALSFSHGDRVEFGNLFGTLPGGGAGGLSAPAPVVINEFLVKPPPGESEFIELFNTTGSPIDISGWKLIVTNGEFESDYTFPAGTTIPEGGWAVDSTATTICDVCLLGPRPGIGTESRLRNGPQARARTQFVGEDFLFDKGGVIQLEDTTNTEIDRVGYGNLGGAPISCPLVVPAGHTPPPGFPGGSGAFLPDAAAPETLSVSTGRTPDGADTGTDQNDFNIGSPTPNGSNTTIASPDLGGSIRISQAFLFPRNDDANPQNESVSFFNPTTSIVNLQNLHLSDGTLIQPMIDADHEVPLEPGQELSFYHGLNATISFEFTADDRMDVYTSTPNGLVRVDQLGWSQIPSYFPDSCLVRVPEGTGPAGGWDWVTSGGDVNLFYEQCNLEAVPTAVFRHTVGATVALGAVSPNPAHGEVSMEIVVGGAAKSPVLAQVGIFDVAGRLVRYVGTGFYAPGRYRVVWDGADSGGARTAPGIYFARILVGGQPAGESRPVVRVGG